MPRRGSKKRAPRPGTPKDPPGLRALLRSVAARAARTFGSDAAGQAVVEAVRATIVADGLPGDPSLWSHVRGRTLAQLRAEGDVDAVAAAEAMARMEATLEDELDRVRAFLEEDHLALIAGDLPWPEPAPPWSTEAANLDPDGPVGARILRKSCARLQPRIDVLGGRLAVVLWAAFRTRRGGAVVKLPRALVRIVRELLRVGQPGHCFERLTVPSVYSTLHRLTY